MNTVTIRKEQSTAPDIRVKYCDTFWSRLLGLMFTKELDPERGIVLAESAESRAGTAIHMMFVNYDIAVLWLDKNKRVVDKVIARRWKPYYVPKQPAQYIVEMHCSRFDDYSLGDLLEFI